MLYKIIRLLQFINKSIKVYDILIINKLELLLLTLQGTYTDDWSIAVGVRSATDTLAFLDVLF